MWWLIPIALGFFAATRGGSSSTPLADDGDDELPPQSVPLWRGVVGRVAWSVASMPGVDAIAWEARIRFVPATGNLPAVQAETLSGAEPDVGAAIRAAIRTAIEQGGSGARGTIQGTGADGLCSFNVAAAMPGWDWFAACGGAQRTARELTRGAAVIKALDSLGAMQPEEIAPGGP